MAKPCTNESPCLQASNGGAHSVVCRKLVAQGSRPRLVARPQPRPSRTPPTLLERAGVTPAGPGDEPVVSRSSSAFEAAAAPLLTGRIGCGCGEVGDLGSREAEVPRNGKLHVYGRPCPPLPERAGREGDQALPEVGAQSVFAVVRQRLDEREALGVKRYGRSLETFNGRNAFRDLQDELLDGLNYATQAEMETRAIVHALLVLARAARGGSPSLEERDAALALAEKLEEQARG